MLSTTCTHAEMAKIFLELKCTTIILGAEAVWVALDKEKLLERGMVIVKFSCRGREESSV